MMLLSLKSTLGLLDAPQEGLVMHQYKINEFGTTPHGGQDRDAGSESCKPQVVESILLRLG